MPSNWKTYFAKTIMLLFNISVILLLVTYIFTISWVEMAIVIVLSALIIWATEHLYKDK